MSNKLVDNKRRSHADKVLQAMSKKASQPGGPSAASTSTSQASEKVSSVIDPLREQYDVIRQDILKLREDISKGYDMAKDALDKKKLLSGILKVR